MLHLGSMLDYLKDNSDSIRPHMEMALWYLIFIFFKSMKNKLVRGKNILDSSPGIVLTLGSRIIVQARLFFFQKNITLYALIRGLHD